MSLLGLDVGGSGCKVAAFDPEGVVLAFAGRSYGQVRPRPDWLEFDLEAQWQALKQAIREVARAPAVQRSPPRALSLSVAGDAMVAVDRQVNQLYPSIATPDERGRAEGEWLAARVGGAERLYELTGQPLDNMYALNRILWFRRHMPELAGRTWKWLCWEDFFFGKLGLMPTIDHSLAARTLAFDLRAQRWSPEMLAAAELDEQQLGTLQRSGTIIGEISNALADELGLPRGIVGVVGGFDQATAPLGAGAVRPGIWSIGTGSVEAVAAPLAQPLLGQAGAQLRTACIAQTPHCGPDVYLVIAYHFAAGTLLRWYRDTLGTDEVRLAEQSGENAYGIISATLPSVPTDLLVLPHFAGAFSPQRDPLSSGAVLGLTLRTSRLELARALLEGTAYEVRRLVEFLEQQGLCAEEIRAVGGGARSDVWLQIKADVLGRPILRPKVTEAGCLAGAILGATALGLYPNLEAAVEAMVQIGDRFEPQPRNVRHYQRCYEIYRDLYPALAPLSHRLLAATRAAE